MRPASSGVASLLALWHLTSLDAPTVAIAWCTAFAWSAPVALPHWLPIVLGLAAWAFYIGDRLLDAHRALRRSQDPTAPGNLQTRHRFHWNHRRVFLPIAVAAAGTGLLLVLHDMPLAARQRNTLLAAAAFAYFSAVHAPRPFALPRLGAYARLPKELLVGLIFTAACALPTWSRLPTGRLLFLSTCLIFACLAWLNCHAIETWESARSWLSPSTHIARLSGGLCLAAMAASGIDLFVQQPRAAALNAAAAASSLALALLHRHRSRMGALTLRAAADLVLLTPLAVFLLR